MSVITSEHAEIKDHAADELLIQLARRYVIVLVLIAALIGLDQAVIQPLMVRIAAFAPAINIAGRQRMLSQNLTKTALELDRAEATDAPRLRELLSATLDAWESAHHRLQSHDAKLGLTESLQTLLRPNWKTLEPHYQAMKQAAEQLRADAAGSNQGKLVQELVDHESSFLSSMEEIVRLIEADAIRQVANLRLVAVAIAAAVVILIVALGRVVVKPAIDTIRNQIALLEARVDQRTHELSAANLELGREIHERQIAEARSRDLHLQLSHAARVSAVGRLAAGLAHELNHPLATIANLVQADQILLEQARVDPTELKEHYDQICEAALRAGRILHSMRGLVRPGKSDHSSVELFALIQSVVELCRHEAAQVRGQITVDSPGPLWVQGDPVQIQQIVLNLLQNSLQALKSSPHERRFVNVSAAAREGSAVVKVQDSGPGFRDIKLDELFSPFYTTKADGLGLGLSICSSLVEQHGGKIWAEEGLSGGAIVYFSLPLANLLSSKATSAKAARV